jgi:serine/threonine protein kinase
MVTCGSRFEKLSAADRRILEAWLEDFERTWDAGRLARLVPHLPPPGSPLRLPILVEIVHIDVQRHWREGRQVLVESYLENYPELAGRESDVTELLLEEFKARKDSGAPATVEEFSQRFPQHAAELRRWLEPGVAPPTAAATPRPGGPGPAAGDGPEPTMPASVRTVVLPPQFGKFRILRKLSSGGMGTVFEAIDLSLDRRVALKVPRFALEHDVEALARFQQEAKAAANLNHPNLCTIYEHGAIDGTLYLAMAYIEGRPLTVLLPNRQPLAQDEAAALVRQIALAMEEAHRCGVVHRDLKPPNILIDDRKVPVIVDFGLARRVNQEQQVRLTTDGELLGTPAYMAPEQIEGTVDAVDHRCDVYSLGVVFYELLTGRVPFEGPQQMVLLRVLYEDPRPPSALRPDLDPRLEAICLRAMAKAVGNRYASMADFAAALEEYLSRKKEPTPPAPARPASSRGDLPKRTWAEVVEPEPAATETPLSEDLLLGPRDADVRRAKRLAIACILLAVLFITTLLLAALLLMARDRPGPPRPSSAVHGAAPLSPVMTGGESP